MQAVAEWALWLLAHPSLIGAVLSLVTAVLHFKFPTATNPDKPTTPTLVPTVTKEPNVLKLIQNLLERRIEKLTATQSAGEVLPSAVTTEIHSAVISKLGDLPTDLSTWVEYLEKFIRILPEIEAAIAKVIEAWKAASA